MVRRHDLSNTDELVVTLVPCRSIEEEEDRRESRRVASQLAGEELGAEGREEREDEQEVEGGKKVFHPVAEHLSWHPVRARVGGREGWQVLAEEAERGGEGEKRREGERRKVEEGGSEKCEPGEALLKVRKLLSQWC